jgi:methylmalonyl-CoA mutase
MSEPNTSGDIIALASGFPAAAREDWLRLVDKTLAGANFDKRLVSHSADGVTIQPLYTADNAAAPLAQARATGRPVDRPWDVRTLIDHPDPRAANAHALEDLRNGAASILLRLDPSGDTGVAVASREDLARVLDGVFLELAPVALDAGFMGSLAAIWLGELAKGAPSAPSAFNLDPLGAFAAAGESPGPMASILRQTGETAAALAQTYPAATLMLASGRIVHEAGGTQAQELGFMLACALAYAKMLTGAGLSLDAAFGAVTLCLSADSEYFTTIAKLRAARVLFARLTAACGVSIPARVEARSSRRMLSRLDPWVNLPRLTAAGFGAAVGGADIIQLDAFTQALGRAAALARRQARNIQLVLMEESHLGRVADPAGGAWFIETLTDQLARAGWVCFQQIEAEGGALAALMSGWLAGEVEAARTARAADIAKRKLGLIGVSEFANLLEAGVPIDQPDTAAFAKPVPELGLTGVADACMPLTPRRDAEPFESLRARAAALTPRPRAALVVLGDPATAAARISFSRNLLTAAGVETEIVALAGYTPSLTPLVILCGTDAAYATQAAGATRSLKAAGARQVCVAGRLVDLEQGLRDAGVDDFVYVGSDIVAKLDHYLTVLER